MNSKIKILHVVGTRPVGGIGAMLKSINQRINLNKFSVSYIFADDVRSGNFDADVNLMGARTIVMPGLKIKNLAKYLTAIFLFYKKNSKNIDILHVHSANTGVLDLFFAFIFGIKVRILHSHSTKYSDSKLRSIRNFILQLPVRKLANNYFACSVSASKFLFGNKNVEKTVIINNAIDTDVFKYNQSVRDCTRKKLDLLDKFVLGHVGSFVEVKNHYFLLYIFSEFIKINADSKLLLVGSGKLEDAIRKRACELNIDRNVLFLGQRNDIPDLLLAMDVFVFPSIFEGLPVSLIEAQTSGLKCFVSDSITEEVNVTSNIKYLSLMDSASSWANCISEFLKGYDREKKLPNMKELGYDIFSEVHKLEILYTNLHSKVNFK